MIVQPMVTTMLWIYFFVFSKGFAYALVLANDPNPIGANLRSGFQDNSIEPDPGTFRPRPRRSGFQDNSIEPDSGAFSPQPHRSGFQDNSIGPGPDPGTSGPQPGLQNQVIGNNHHPYFWHYGFMPFRPKPGIPFRLKPTDGAHLSPTNGAQPRTGPQPNQPTTSNRPSHVSAAQMPGCGFLRSGKLEPWDNSVTIRNISIEPDFNHSSNHPEILEEESPGFYGMHAASQLEFLRLLYPQIKRDAHEGAVIYDLGCADGLNSMELLHLLKKHFHNFTMAFVDLPKNDWKTVRGTIKTVLDRVYPPEDGAVMMEGDNVNFIRTISGAKGALIAKSFYKQVAPDASVHIAFSANALHYLSQTVLSNRKNQAAEDWRMFLVNRQKELMPGGTLHIIGMTEEYPGGNRGRLSMVLDGTLQEAVAKRIITTPESLSWRWHGYARTESEWREPFKNNEFPGLELVKFKTLIFDSAYWQQADGDACEFAKMYVQSVMAYAGNYIISTLGEKVRNIFYMRLTEDVRLYPFQYKHETKQAIIEIRRKNVDGPIPATLPAPGQW